MTKFILVLVLITGLWTSNYPKDITGKWQVDDIIFSKADANIPEDQKAMALAYIKKTLLNSTFEFGADHHFYLTPTPQGMPNGESWKYDAQTGTVKIFDGNNKKAALQITITEKKDGTFFQMDQAPVSLKVHKKTK